jgi:hypothetical protein
MASPLPYPIHPIADAAAQIAQGEDPWFALGSFLHDWWCYAVDERAELITEPPTPGTTLEEKRWAAFCAATVEELCARTGFPLPTWTCNSDYTLEQPWFYDSQLSQREWLLTTTPTSFQRHNIFVGGGILDNKYELRQFETKPRWAVWTDEELQKLAKAKKDASIASE